MNWKTMKLQICHWPSLVMLCVLASAVHGQTTDVVADVVNSAPQSTVGLSAETAAETGADVEGEKQAHEADVPRPSPGKRHTDKLEAVRNGDFDVVMVGDSITHTLDNFGGKYAPLGEVWKQYFEPLNALNLGYSGYRTEQILWHMQNGELDFKRSPKVFVLLIGTNNTDDRHFEVVHTAEQVFRGTRAIVEEIRKRHDSSKIVVLRIFPRGGDDEQGVSPPAFNSSKQCIETCRKAGELTKSLADGNHVYWLDVNSVFLNPDGKINTKLLWDLLHPGPEGAEAWAKAIIPTIKKLMAGEKVPAIQSIGK